MLRRRHSQRAGVVSVTRSSATICSNVEKRDVARRRRFGVAVGGGQFDPEAFADERGAGAGGGEEDEGHWGKNAETLKS